MDVIVTPVEDESAWWLTDRSGRPLGAIRKIPGSSAFTIVSETENRLHGLPAHHASLDGALRAIEERVGGTCEFNSGMKD